MKSAFSFRGKVYLSFLAVLLCALCAICSCAGEDQDRDEEGFLNDDDLAEDDDDLRGRIAFIDTHPNDDLLYAGLNCVPITPTRGNHPKPMFMGGTGPMRIAEGIHDDLEACALVLRRNEEKLVLVSLDLLGIVQPRVRLMMDRLERRGFPRERVFISSTHSHNGPDTVGLWGMYVITGLDYAYLDFLVDSVEEAVTSADAQKVPVQAVFATGVVEFPGSNYPALMRDSRDPWVADDRIHAIRFDAETGGTVATLVNFGNHPETALRFDWFSADYPRYLRERLAMEYGGGAIYLSGALGGLITPLDVSVPARDENGDPITEGGEVVWWTEFSWERTRAYGYVLAETVIDLLDAREPTPVTEIRVRSREYLLPITNIVLYLAHMARIIEPFQEVHEPGCGPFGCIAEKASVIAFGDVQITTSPGETFPETILGRQEVTIDYGDPWGEKTYEAIDGVLDYYTQPVAMHFGLTNNFLGYIVPENDYLPVNHPEHYCEIFSAGKTGERLLRETLIEILDRDD